MMERVIEYSGIVSVSSYRRGDKSVHVATRDFHSLPTNPVISHKVIIQKAQVTKSILMCGFITNRTLLI